MAQYHIALKNAPVDIKPSEYYLAGVEDNRTQKKAIGSIISASNDKISVSLAGGVKSSIQHFIEKNLPKNKTLIPVLYKLTELQVKETGSATTGVNGRMSLKVDFERISKSDTVFLANADVYMDYRRSGGSPGMSNYESVLRQLIIRSLRFFDDWMAVNHDKHEALSTGVQITFLPDYQINDRDTIHYETRKVNWDDFQGKPSVQSRFGAAIFSNFAYQSSFYVAQGLIHARIQTRTYMVRGMSWANESAKNTYSLAHEQLHFDITKLVTERFKKKVLSMNAESIDDLNSMIQYEYLESYKEMNRLQKQYDEETRHSQDTIRQTEWAQKIEIWLNELTG